MAEKRAEKTEPAPIGKQPVRQSPAANAPNAKPELSTEDLDDVAGGCASGKHIPT